MFFPLYLKFLSFYNHLISKEKQDIELDLEMNEKNIYSRKEDTHNLILFLLSNL